MEPDAAWRLSLIEMSGHGVDHLLLKVPQVLPLGVVIPPEPSGASHEATSSPAGSSRCT